ncbi:MAG: DnaJ domain-containing protein [Ilumatobacteraceae bacterium]
MTTHYDVLGIDRRATHDEVRTAYRRAARRLHPDAGGDDSTVGRMAVLNEAWRVLGDGDRRRDYDRWLDAAAVPSTPSGDGRSGHIPTVPMSREPRFNPFARYQDPPRVPWRPMAVMAALGAIAVVLASALSPSVPTRPVDGMLLAGECVSIDTSGAAVEVLCDGAQDGVAESIVTDPLQCPQHTEAHPAAAVGTGIVCVRV